MYMTSNAVQVKPIRTEQDYAESLLRLRAIFRAERGTPEADEAEVLGLLVEAYEDEHYPVDPPHPIEAIKIRMEDKGLKQKDLIGIIGSKSRVSEVLNCKKKLTLEMVRHLHKVLDIPTNTLVQDYPLTA